jgi:hypothetical protein
MFYKHPQMSDGHLGKCKECTKKDATEYRNANIEKVRDYDRRRGKKPERIKHSTEMTRRWRAEDSRRQSAHLAVARAIYAGSLEKKDCCRCGRHDSWAHHENYDRPLDVMWLCPVCHKQRHKELAIAGIEP